MLLEFTKMNGAGNDFVLFDNRDERVKLTSAIVGRICDRHAGVGGDGIIGLVRCASGQADWAWQFFNSDGSAAEMCGNGARCFARYVRRTTGGPASFSFETTAGVIGARIEGDLVTVDLTQPVGLRLNEELPLGHGAEMVHSLNTGVPHAVLFVEDADQAMVSTLGREIRRHGHFAPRGTNVNFVQLIEPGSIRVRTYERGVEGETLACGTGVTASALISAQLHGFPSPVRVRVQAGDQLEVSFKQNGTAFNEVRLKGPADFVFDGTIDI